VKLQKHAIHTKKHSRLKIEADWTDKMRRPAAVEVVIHKGNDIPSKDLIDADAKEGTDTMYALADLAWELGWRPRGLTGTLAGLVANYKLPPEGV
jgi:hypothetical protein